MARDFVAVRNHTARHNAFQLNNLMEALRYASSVMPNGHDKNFVRLCAVLDGFHEQYGRWPTRVRLHAGALEDLKSLFSAEDFAKLGSRIEFLPGDPGMIAEDDEGGRYGGGVGQELSGHRLAPGYLGVKPRREGN